MSYPINHLSYSSFYKFHTDQGAWREKYIMGNDVFKPTPAMIVGKMAHAVIDCYMSGHTIDESIQNEMRKFEAIPDSEIDYGKTGSRAGVIEKFTGAVKMYFEEMPNYEQIIAHEEKIESTIEDIVAGVTMTSPIPLVGYPDLILRESGKLGIEDYKFKATHSDSEDGIDPSYMIQGIFYFLLVRKHYGEAPAFIRFREIKISQNKDKSSQMQVITIDCTSEEFETARMLFWFQLMGMCKIIENATADTYFPYNIFDRLNGRDTMRLLSESQFGYGAKEGRKDSMVRMDKADLKEARFLESKSPDTIEGKIAYKFQEFGVALSFEKRVEGHAFDRYLFVPSRGVKMSDVKKYVEDVSQATEIENVRILAPVPGTKYVGVEIPRSERRFKKYTKSAGVPVGVDIDGKIVAFSFADTNTPHLIVAGRTGSGKSEFLKVMISALSSKEHSLILIDPKYVELSRFREKAEIYGSTANDSWQILDSLTQEMERRYKSLESEGVNDIAQLKKPLKRKVVFIEEYASLRLDKQYGKDIEELVVKLTNLGRAAGIHIVLATQRPDVTVISGRIKANIGARVCFACSSAIDSKIILDEAGAEKLTGKGDMLYRDPNTGIEPIRLQSYHL